MEDLLANQNQIIEAVEKFYINFKKDGAERKTHHYIKKRLEVLENYYREFEMNHIKLSEYEKTDFPYFIDNYHSKFTNLCRDVRKAMYQFLPEVEDQPMTPRPGSIEWSTTLQQTASAGTSGRATSSSQAQQQQSTPSSFASKVDKGNQSKLEEMFRKQKSNFKALSRAIDTANVETLSEKWEYEDVLRTIQARWTVLDDLHWEIDSELMTENPEYENTYYHYEEKYKQIKNLINSKIWSVSHREKTTPTMEIPTFSGSYQQWTSFQDLFLETIHKNKSISKAQKMQFLKSKVKGEAERLIQHLNISSDNYDTCWEILTHRYNNIKLIFNSHLSILLGLTTMQHQSAAIIKRMHDTTNECLYAIKNLGIDTATWDPIIVYLLSQKLDSETHNEYIAFVKDTRELPKLSEFLQFLEIKFTALESSRRKHEQFKSANQTEVSQKPSSSKSNYRPFVNTKIYQSTSQKCPLCNKDHGLFHCKTFLESKPEAKLRTVSKHNLCENCLYKHNGKKCFSEKRCLQCNNKHNTLLHDAYNSSKNINTCVGKGSSNDKYVTHVSQGNVTEVLLATAMIDVVSIDGTFIKLRALIDQGSQASLITENAAQRLGLSRHQCKGLIFGIGTNENNCKGVMTITASSLCSDFVFSTEVFIMSKLLNNLPNRSFNNPSWSYLEGLRLADPDFHISRPVDILLGADIYCQIIMSGIIRKNEMLPIAQQSRLGWIICGNMTSYQCNVVVHNLEEISKFWAIEDIGENTDDLSSEEQHCIQQYQSTTFRQKDGRYVVRLPLKPDIQEKLGESKQRAIAQFGQLEKKFQKNEFIASNYKSFIEEYKNLGHMKQCTNKTAPSYFLPHHCVIRADSTTTALRVVFNASSKTTSGSSLNDLMYAGPNLQSDLLSLILRWRQYKYAYTADIEKMFRQIMCNKKDQGYQKIVWRDNENQELRDYVLTTVTYGTKAAPFLAMMTLKQLANDERHLYPEAAKILERDFYMDDLVSGSHSIPTAKQLQTDLIKLLQSGGFNLRKWSSNSKDLLLNVNQSSSSSTDSEMFNFKHQESTKALGLRWHPLEDVFTFQLKIDCKTSKPSTKRLLLSEVSKIFDPLGWLCPVTTKLKLLFQTVWQQNLQWDDKLPESINREWKNIKDNLSEIESIKISRWLQCKENEDIEFHGFCDASEKAYACVIYSKITQQPKNTSSIIIVAAKSRVVPTKKVISLPRLELCAAHLLSKLMHTVTQKVQDHKIKIFGWSDSTAVLGWINGDTSRWKTFVANRINQIKDVMPAKCWNYVKSTENPADCASRGILASQLKGNELWWQGPHWLPSYQTETHEKSIYKTDQEVRSPIQSNAGVRHDDVIMDIINKHSCLSRASRVLAWVIRAVSYNKPRSNYLTSTELKSAKNIFIKKVQEIQFYEEIKQIKQAKNLKHTSKLLPLNPYLDQDGLLRVGGRLKNACISENMKHPLIIPHKHHFTNILIDKAHKMTFHGGPRLTLAWLRREFWIIGGLRAVKERLHYCVTCKRQNPIKQNQIMGDLPLARCNPTRPFFHTGVDLTGYINVKASRGRGIKTTKGYVVVFVCMVTKAVHLEVASDLSSSAFLATLRRLVARRGAPRHMYSDNGTNFVGANKQLMQEYVNLKETLDEEFFAVLAELEIEWHFNAPSWPSAGGLWEAAVKSLKYHLRRVIGDQKLTFEEMSTLLAQIEGCLNSRPLCAMTEDPEDIDFITPSHFLASGPTLTIIETEKDERTRWQLVQKIYADIWKRWKAEYLTQLSSRSKWQQPKDNIKIDDVVIIHDANLPAGKWALGRVIELHPGPDGYVRVVTLKTKNGAVKRPIVKLSRLPVDNEPKTERSKDKDLELANNQNQKTDSSQSEKTESKPSRSRTQRPRKGISNCSFLAMLTLLVVNLVTSAKCDYRISTLSTNQSIYFDKVSNMQLIRDEWKLIIYYNMDPYWQGIKLFNKYIENLQSTCSRASKQVHCNLILLQLQHSLTELEYYNSIMLGKKNTASQQRAKRGLINGVGYVAHSLFGVLDESFAEQYQKDINLIRHNQKHLALMWKNQTSVIEAEYNVLKRIESAMNNQHKLFNQHLVNLEKATNTLAEKVADVELTNELSVSSIIANSILVNLKSVQDTLLDTITNIKYGSFNIHLLSPQQLRDELNIVSGLLSRDLALPIKNIQTELQKIYHLLKVQARMTDQYFIFEIKIPLVSRDNFEIYNLIDIPQQNGRNMISVQPISNYIAINVQKDSFVTISPNDLQQCMSYDDNTQLCFIKTPIYHITSDNALCIMDQISQQCKVNVKDCTDRWTELKQLNTHLFFCCNQRKIKVICEDQITAPRLTGAGIIYIGEGCVVKDENFTIYAHKTQKSTLHLQSDLLAIDIPSINNIINLSVPITNGSSVTSYQGDLTRIGKQIDQIKGSDVTDELTDTLSDHDVHQFVILYLLVGAGLLASALFAARRCRRATAIAPSPHSDYNRTQDSTSSVQIHQEINRPSESIVMQERPVPIQQRATSTASGLNSARVLNKATSPFFSEQFI